MELQTIYDFTLPKGYVDPEGNLHRTGRMRLATAGDELFAMRDPRVKAEAGYMTVVLLSRVILNLGTLSEVTPEMVEGMFTGDMNFLQNMYQTINESEQPTIHVVCPHCGKEFSDTLNFTQLA